MSELQMLLEEPYVLKKYGKYYAHNNCGYTESWLKAEIYTKDYAVNHAKNIDGIKAVPISSLNITLESLNEYLMRINVVQKYLQQLGSADDV